MQSLLNKNNDSINKDYHNLILFLDKDRLCELQAVFNKNKNVLNHNGFINAINQLPDNERNYKEEAQSLFEASKKSLATEIAWSELLEYLAHYLQPKSTQLLEMGEPEYIQPPHVKRDSIVKITSLETKAYFCYAIITKYGRVGLYDGNLDFLTSYSVIMVREDINRNDDERRKRNRWITDAIFAENALMYIVANSTRSITIYDASGLNHTPLWLILGFPYVIQYQAFYENKLCFGMENGKILYFKFCRMKESLLRRKHNDKMSTFFYQELLEEKDYVTIKTLNYHHTMSITNIQYIHEGKTIISSSDDPDKAIILQDFNGKKAPVVFKIRKGANCFTISTKLKIMVTGCHDGTLRVWNSLVTTKALNTSKNKFAVVDVAIIEALNMFFSCHENATLRLWDLKENVCLEAIDLEFPAINIAGKTIDWGCCSIFGGPKRKNGEESCLERGLLLVTCCNHYAKICLYYYDGRDRNVEEAVLPPPPLQNSFLIPKDWNVCNRDANESEVKVEKSEIDLSHLKFILEKDILEELGKKNDINYKIARLESKKLEMRWLVENCAPYMAMDLHEVTGIILPHDLPIPSNKKVRKLAENTRILLEDAAVRTAIFSDLSSSSKSPRSSRSSIVDFEQII